METRQNKELCSSFMLKEREKSNLQFKAGRKLPFNGRTLVNFWLVCDMTTKYCDKH